MNRDLVGLIQRVLAAAGCRKPQQTAHLTVQSLAPASNPFKATKKHSGSLALSTYSERISDIDTDEAAQAATRALEQMTLAALRQHPPGGDVYCAIDTHDVEYFSFGDGETSCVRRRLRRQSVALAATAANKRSPWVHRWLVAALTWRNGAQVWTLPIRVQMLLPIDMSPSIHAGEVCRQLKRLGVPVKACLLDRYYQGVETRETFDRYGFDFRIRYTAHQNSNLTVFTEDGRLQSLYSLLKETVAHPEAQKSVSRMSLSGRPVLEFRRVVRVRFPKGGDWAYMP